MIVVKPQLSKILKERGMTQMELSEKSGVNQATISRFDKSTRFEAWHLIAISRALGVSIEDLFEVIETSD
ncbi:helix-turn-helix family protein [Geobacillus kaustophilus]|uniref:Helix-turn-helix family protein n=1 Tax=Geobacillus kaustophilus TaxID=1462 RepID=A0A0D8BXV9_GEOKU|nr:helix-turn-helix transcriptional regulator [Geobacillus kaustophilus]KJE29023.1 helix-turn-helix family protein [Geobacillus kaustophilus]